MKQKIVNHITRFKGFYTGLLFASLSIFSLFLIAPPLISACICGIIEMFCLIFMNSEPYQKLVTLVLIILCGLFLLVVIFLLRYLKYNYMNKKTALLFYSLFYLLHVSIVNYLYWWFKCDFCGRTDGQVFFQFCEPIPNVIASLIFLLEGVTLDLYFVKFNKLKSISIDAELPLDETKIQELMQLHKITPSEELQGIIESPDWIPEAKEAARQLLLLRTSIL